MILQYAGENRFILKDFFFNLAKFIKNASLKGKLLNSNDVVLAIKSGQEGANEYSRINLGLPPVQTFAFEYFRNTKTEKPQKYLPIQDISNFYN